MTDLGGGPFCPPPSSSMSSPEKAHPKKGSDVPPLKGGAESTKDLKRHKTVFSKAIVETI